MNHTLLLPFLAALVAGGALHADGELLGHQQIDDLQGGFGGVLSDGDDFGAAVVTIGDLDGDGVKDLAVGAPGTDDGGTNAGAVWILRMNADGTVKKQRKLSQTSGGFAGVNVGRLGQSLARLGDVDGDGIEDLAVSSDDLIHVLFLNADGTVAAQTDHATVSFWSVGSHAVVAGLDDLDGDGTPDMVVRGVVSERLLFALLNPDGTIKSVTQYDPAFATTGGSFGESIVLVGDVDGDGVKDLAVGDPQDADGGAVWILFLDSSGGVSGARENTAVDIGYNAPGSLGDLGESLARLGDADGSGVPDLLAGTKSGDGVLWTLFLESDGGVRSYVAYLEPDYGATEFLDDFGQAVEAVDLDGDGVKDWIVGAPDTDAAGADRGAVHVYFYEGASVGSIALYPGCGVNPAGSLLATGTPAVGGQVSFAIDNPLGTQSPGSLAFLALSTAGAAGGSCGVPLPGFNMDPAKPNGELLVAAPIALTLSAGALWLGAGQPVDVPVPIPNDASFLGVEIFAQGLLLDPGAGLTGTQPLGLTRGARVTLGT